MSNPRKPVVYDNYAIGDVEASSINDEEENTLFAREAVEDIFRGGRHGYLHPNSPHQQLMLAVKVACKAQREGRRDEEAETKVLHALMDHHRRVYPRELVLAMTGVIEETK